MHVCKKCHQAKDLSEFGTHKQKRLNEVRINSYCKECARKIANDYRNKNKERAIQTTRKHSKAMQEWTKKNRAWFSNTGKKWSKEDEEYLIDFYKTTDITELAYALERTPKSIQSKYFLLNKQAKEITK